MRTLRTSTTLTLILGLGLPMAALTACNQGGGDETASGNQAPAPAPGRGSGGVQTTPAGLGPVISFARLNHDFGEISDTEVYSTNYEFTNTGGQTLVIESVKASCGCTLPTLSKYRYEPGETGEISVDFDPKAMKDAKTKKVTVISNAKNTPNGVSELTFTVQIKPLLRLDTRFLSLGRMPFGRENRGRLGLTYWDQQLEITKVSCNQDHLSAALVETAVPQSDGSFRSQIEVTVAEDSPWGSLYGAKLFIEVEGRPFPAAEPITYDYEAYVQGYMFGEIHAESSSRGRQASPTSMMGLGSVGPGGTINTSIRLFSPRGMGFTVHGATIVDSPIPGLETRVEQLESSSWRVHLSGSVGNYVGPIRGMLTVQTDVSGEEELPIRFIGSIR